jgi:hypothetical protein
VKKFVKTRKCNAYIFISFVDICVCIYDTSSVYHPSRKIQKKKLS